VGARATASARRFQLNWSPPLAIIFIFGDRPLGGGILAAFFQAVARRRAAFSVGSRRRGKPLGAAAHGRRKE
jgi:hypothetical protein